MYPLLLDAPFELSARCRSGQPRKLSSGARLKLARIPWSCREEAGGAHGSTGHGCGQSSLDYFRRRPHVANLPLGTPHRRTQSPLRKPDLQPSCKLAHSSGGPSKNNRPRTTATGPRWRILGSTPHQAMVCGQSNIENRYMGSSVANLGLRRLRKSKSSKTISKLCLMAPPRTICPSPILALVLMVFRFSRIDTPPLWRWSSDP